MADGGREGDFGRGERVGGGDEDVEVPETGWVGEVSAVELAGKVGYGYFRGEGGREYLRKLCRGNLS